MNEIESIIVLKQRVPKSLDSIQSIKGNFVLWKNKRSRILSFLKPIFRTFHFIIFFIVLPFSPVQTPKQTLRIYLNVEFWRINLKEKSFEWLNLYFYFLKNNIINDCIMFQSNLIFFEKTIYSFFNNFIKKISHPLSSKIINPNICLKYEATFQSSIVVSMWSAHTVEENKSFGWYLSPPLPKVLVNTLTTTHVPYAH
jgi:hypothetical protein